MAVWWPGFDTNDTLGVLNDLWEFNPLSQEWAWMGGSGTIPAGDYGPPAVYGTMIEPETQNIPGGRTRQVEWTDGSGNFWLFGGSGVGGGGGGPSLATPQTQQITTSGVAGLTVH